MSNSSTHLLRSGAVQVGQAHIRSVHRVMPKVTLCSCSLSLQQVVLIDPGANADLMDQSLVDKLQLGREPLGRALSATVLNGEVLWRGQP